MAIGLVASGPHHYCAWRSSAIVVRAAVLQGKEIKRPGIAVVGGECSADEQSGDPARRRHAVSSQSKIRASQKQPVTLQNPQRHEEAVRPWDLTASFSAFRNIRRALLRSGRRRCGRPGRWWRRGWPRGRYDARRGRRWGSDTRGRRGRRSPDWWRRLDARWRWRGANLRWRRGRPTHLRTRWRWRRRRGAFDLRPDLRLRRWSG